jgi:hypothetical protein
MAYKDGSRPGRRASVYTFHFSNDWIDVSNHCRTRYLIHEHATNQVLSKTTSSNFFLLGGGAGMWVEDNNLHLGRRSG